MKRNMQNLLQPLPHQIAKTCHEVNKAFCESIGDDSQLSWDEAEEWQRQSAIAGVRYRIDNPDGKPEDQHISWLKDTLKDGWKFGTVKNAEKKR